LVDEKKRVGNEKEFGDRKEQVDKMAKLGGNPIYEGRQSLPSFVPSAHLIYDFDYLAVNLLLVMRSVAVELCLELLAKSFGSVTHLGGSFTHPRGQSSSVLKNRIQISPWIANVALYVRKREKERTKRGFE
jgi:hypothetical protein